jgi:RimJ/RimL family protein N-acetyltransferase
LKNEDKLIGFVNMTKENTPDEIVYSLGYIFHSQYHGFGYAFEACSAYMNYIHKNNKEYSIICGTSEANTKSCNLLEKLGFKQIQKSKTSFQNDDNNNPILFTGITYKYTNM